MAEIEKVKEILDRECYELWRAKRCSQYDNNLKFIHTPCWLCDRNYELARRITEVLVKAN